MYPESPLCSLRAPWNKGLGLRVPQEPACSLQEKPPTSPPKRPTKGLQRLLPGSLRAPRGVCKDGPVEAHRKVSKTTG